MKKFLIIIILFFSWNGNAYAGCIGDIDFSNEWFMGKEAILGKFKNKSDKNIKISRVYIQSKDYKLMRKDLNMNGSYVKYTLAPYSVLDVMLDAKGLNLDMVRGLSYECSYLKKVNKTNNSSSSSSSSSSSKSKQKSGSSVSSKSLLKKLLGKD